MVFGRSDCKMLRAQLGQQLAGILRISLAPLFVVLEQGYNGREIRGEPIMDFPRQVEPLLEHGHLCHLDRQTVGAQGRDCLSRQVFEPDGITPVESPRCAAEQGEHPDRSFERWRQHDGREATVAGVDPGRLVRRELLRGQVLDREYLVVLERPPQQPAADGGNALRRSQRLGGHPGAQEEPPLLAKRVDLAGIHLEQIERLLGGRQEDGLQGPRHLFGNQPRGLKLRRHRCRGGGPHLHGR